MPILNNQMSPTMPATATSGFQFNVNSNHGSGVVAAYCDGHVSFLRSDVDGTPANVGGCVPRRSSTPCALRTAPVWRGGNRRIYSVATAQCPDQDPHNAVHGACLCIVPASVFFFSVWCYACARVGM